MLRRLSRTTPHVQRKLRVGAANDPLEAEADRVADHVMRMPDVSISSPSAPAVVQRKCEACEEEEKNVRKKSDGQNASAGEAPPIVHDVLGSPGHPLDAGTRAFFEPRFGADFSRVRVHSDSVAVQSTGAVNALAYTRGSDIVFGQDQYQPATFAGRKLVAHELAHVVQQGAARPGYQQTSADDSKMVPIGGNAQTVTAGDCLQRWPGDGMLPPGDCSWGTYLSLRGAVETAKTLVDSMGACAPGDSCTFLATKIAAVTAEIAARVALDTTCFRGGDAGHREQVTGKVGMLNRCYQFFLDSDCPQRIVEAMKEVVKRALEVIAAAALAVVAAVLIVALAEAIAALVAAIAAAIAAAAAAVAEAAAVAALAALVLLILRQISPADSGPTA